MITNYIYKSIIWFFAVLFLATIVINFKIAIYNTWPTHSEQKVTNSQTKTDAEAKTDTKVTNDAKDKNSNIVEMFVNPNTALVMSISCYLIQMLTMIMFYYNCRYQSGKCDYESFISHLYIFHKEIISLLFITVIATLISRPIEEIKGFELFLLFLLVACSFITISKIISNNNIKLSEIIKYKNDKNILYQPLKFINNKTFIICLIFLTCFLAIKAFSNSDLPIFKIDKTDEIDKIYEIFYKSFMFITISSIFIFAHHTVAKLKKQ
ncbi:hypothetical protein [Maridesulfovibrio bastinii]|uniref:hypothetical protein n=1 Tax=Maridesulfovibrio bastinii TaxID=47157 RepID=UPI0004268209|nr:hypothetical protein [Maridesulfovibrio bastinii]